MEENDLHRRWPQNSRLQARGLGLQLPFRVRGHDQTLTRERGNRAPAHRTIAEGLVAPHPYVWPEDGPASSQFLNAKPATMQE
jgi:hypothetical protein